MAGLRGSVRSHAAVVAHRATTGGSFCGILTLATGTAFFKPSIQGRWRTNLTKENSSVGWGIFYWVVNVGAFIGHFLPSVLLGLSVLLPGPLHAEANSPEAWRNLFLASAVFTSFNLLLLLTFRGRALRRVEDGVAAAGAQAHAGEHARAAPARLDGHHVVLLADDVPALGPAAELHRRLGGQRPDGAGC